MAELDTRTFIARSKDAWRLKDQWRGAYEDAYTYAMPQRDPYERSSPGSPRGLEVFDSTAMISTTRFAGKFVSDLFPAGRNWCKLEAGPGVPKQHRSAVNAVLDEATETMFSIIHHVSDFQTAIGELATDFAVGTGSMLIQPSNRLARPVIYEAIPQVQVALEEGPHNSVEGIYRNMQVPARTVMGFWPDAKMSDELKKLAQDQPNRKVRFAEGTYWDRDTEVWYYDVLDVPRERFMVRRRYRNTPWATPRFMKAPGEVNGRGPLLQAMPDIKTLNKLVELVLKNASLAVSGVYTGVDDGVLNPSTVSLNPGTVITVGRNQGHPAGPSLAPLERAGDFEVSTIEQDRLVSSIRKTLLDEGLPPPTGSVRSATEIIERAQEISQQLGATFGRVISELMIPIVQRTLDILIASRLIQIPNNVSRYIDVTGSGVKLTVTSPLAHLQNLDDAKAVIQWLELLNTLFDPAIVMQSAKVEDIPAWIGRKLGVAAELIRTDEERRQLRDQVAQLVAQAQLAQQQGAEEEGAEPATRLSSVQ